MSTDGPLYDVMVIGSGFAGMAASLFAADRGLKVAQAGSTGGIDFSTGFIDLMGVHPVSEGKRWMNPWRCMEQTVKDVPGHPYGLMSRQDVAQAIDEFVAALSDNGLHYVGNGERNSCIMTPVGTVKRTYRVPLTTWKGVEALEKKAPTLIVDFHGLKGFSGKQLVQMRKGDWPDLRCTRVEFPGSRGELYPEHMAWQLADAGNREQLAGLVMEHVGDAEYIGFPAVLGLNDPMSVLNHLEALTGKAVFEIPTMPPSLAGPRLRAVFDRCLPAKGVRTLSQKMVGATTVNDEGMTFSVGKGGAATTVRAKTAVLCTGRFFGKGLTGQRHKVVEPLFDLPVLQPDGREGWHRQEFFDAKGHPVNMAGIAVDGDFRPLDHNGAPVHAGLFAAGAILANHDWMRMKCGAGLGIATAYKAVTSLLGKVDN